MRITKEDMSDAVACYMRAAESLGMVKAGHTLHCVEGSKALGNGFKLVWVDNESGGNTHAPGTDYNGFIGWTKREALEKIYTITRSFEEVHLHLMGN